MCAREYNRRERRWQWFMLLVFVPILLWNVNGWALTQNRAPTGDNTTSGTWSGSTNRYQVVDDYPDNSVDNLAHGTTAGYIVFTYSPFTLPDNATNISIQVRYVDNDRAAGTNKLSGLIVTGGTRDNAALHEPASAVTVRTDNFATNPRTSGAWTVCQVNGTCASNLHGFGVQTNDANPVINLWSIELQATYTESATGIKAIDNLLRASVSKVDNLAIGSVKAWAGLP